MRKKKSIKIDKKMLILINKTKNSKEVNFNEYLMNRLTDFHLDQIYIEELNYVIAFYF